jgi:hypothetical protein
MIRVALVLALFVIAAASSIVLADECDPGEPCKENVTVIGYESAPACTGPVWDGAILADNSSSVYWYKVTVTARVENDSDGNPRCSNNDPPECSGQSCERDLSVSFIVKDYKEQHKSAALPSCDCDVHCDNDPETECSPEADHCVCVIGTYTVNYYSDDFGETWTAMEPSYPSVITEKERNPLCADPGPGCD